MGYFGNYLGQGELTEGGGIQPPDDPANCSVYAFVKHAAGAVVQFELDPAKVRDGWIYAKHRFTETINSDGQLSIEIPRADYLVSCAPLGLRYRRLTIDAPIFDLATIIK